MRLKSKPPVVDTSKPSISLAAGTGAQHIPITRFDTKTVEWTIAATWFGGDSGLCVLESQNVLQEIESFDA